MSKHTHKATIGWGSKERKEEDRLRGINATDRRLAIEEQLAEVAEVEAKDEIKGRLRALGFTVDC